MTIHVMALPDEGMMQEDESLCTDGRATEVVFHVACEPLGHDDGYVCRSCGESSGPAHHTEH